MNILIIEDEYSLADAVAETLKSEKFNVCIKSNGEDGEDEALTENYDLILLDVMLPQKNGFEILKYLRQEKIKTPIIMLTAKSEIDDKLNGLENGADDYITKPFAMKELVARIKAVLKRTNNIDDTSFLEFGDITLDLKNANLKCNENEIQISGKELEILEQLLLNKNQILSRESLLERIWGYESDAEYNNVEVYITFIRRKLKLIESKVNIKAVRGIGYKLEEKDDK
ncbi:MAG: response regulator transcription factor [Clostridia bacterium]|nr:response regulator transcription factor [Clostridia bacterium]